MNERNPIPIKAMRERYEYDPETGVFRTLKRKDRRQVGYVNKRGYVMLRIEGKHYLAHRMAWAYYYDEQPPTEIDHINCNGADNRIANLREANGYLNCQNQSSRRRSPSGVKCVKPTTTCKKPWMAAFWAYGRRVYLGTFDTVEEASAAYEAAAKEIFGEYARVR